MFSIFKSLRRKAHKNGTLSFKLVLVSGVIHLFLLMCRTCLHLCEPLVRGLLLRIDVRERQHSSGTGALSVRPSVDLSAEGPPARPCGRARPGRCTAAHPGLDAAGEDRHRLPPAAPPPLAPFVRHESPPVTFRMCQVRSTSPFSSVKSSVKPLPGLQLIGSEPKTARTRSQVRRVAGC